MTIKLIQIVAALMILAVSECLGVSPCDTSMEYLDGHWACRDQYWSQYETNSEIEWENAFGDMCSSGGAVAIYTDCMKNTFSACSDISSKMDGWLDVYRGQFCDGGSTKFKDSIMHLMAELVMLDGLPCFKTQSGQRESGLCLAESSEVSSLKDIFNETPYVDSVDEIERVVTNWLRCVRNVLKTRSNCDDDTLTAVMHYNKLAYFMPGMKEEVVENNPDLDPRSSLRATVAVFGDPHVKAYSTEGVITCAAPGWTNYLNNVYVSIEGNNTVASPGRTATYMTAVEITFRDSNLKELARYTADNGQLPPSFVNGTDTAGSGDSTVEISNIKDYILLIKQAASGAGIILAENKGTYHLVARFSESVLKESSGLLKAGCLDKIDRSSVTKRRRRRRDACTDACAKVPTEFQETCEFDCDVTGNAEMAAFQGEVSDMESDVEKLDSELGNGSDGNGGGNGSASGENRSGSIWGLQQTLFIILLAMVMTLLE